MLTKTLLEYMLGLKGELKAIEEQLLIYKQIQEGTIIHAESQQIYVANCGVGQWLPSYKPALLRSRGWSYSTNGFTLEFDVIASQDPEPYNLPWESNYSGKRAQILGPKYYSAKKIKIVPLIDVLTYIDYPHKTNLFETLINHGSIKNG